MQKRRPPQILANRTDWKFKPNQLALRLKTLRESGVEILDLSESNPTRCKFQYLNNQLLSSLAQPENLSYKTAKWSGYNDPSTMLRINR